MGSSAHSIRCRAHRCACQPRSLPGSPTSASRRAAARRRRFVTPANCPPRFGAAPVGRAIAARWEAASRSSPCQGEAAEGTASPLRSARSIWTGVDDDAFHHNRIARLKRVLDQVECMAEDRIDPFVIREARSVPCSTRSSSLGFAASLPPWLFSSIGRRASSAPFSTCVRRTYRQLRYRYNRKR
jgi:hypothetical protein